MLYRDLVLGSFSGAVLHVIGGMNDELDNFWKEVIVVCLKPQSQHLRGEIKKNHATPLSG
jgi:hypothetical protein